MAQIKPLQTTLLKTHPVDSNLAPDRLPAGFRKFNVPKTNQDGTDKVLYAAKVIRDIANYAKVVFDPGLTIGGTLFKELYVFAPHWEGITATIDAMVATASPLSPAGSSIVERPGQHWTQKNNFDWNDDGSASNLRYGGVQCGGTSLANTLSQPGLLTDKQIAEVIAGSPTGNFDDGVLAIFKKIGAQSILMEGHAAVCQYLGLEAHCRRDATVAELKEWIEKKCRVPAGFDYKDSGHFVCASGFDIKKNLVKILDPFGIRDKVSTNQWEKVFADEDQAEVDWYSAQIMADLWASSQNGWATFITPRQPQVVLSPAPIEVIQQNAGQPAQPAKTAPVATVAANTITITTDTFLKTAPVQSITLDNANKRLYKAGTTISCEVIGAKQGHGQIKLADTTVWFVFNDHFKGQEAKAGMVASNAGRGFCIEPAKLRAAVGKLANPSVPASELDAFCKAFAELAPKYTITKREHVIHFLAQAFHESGGMMYLEELASGADYDDRDDLGNCEPAALAAAAKAGISVGRFYKGHSLIQTTGYANHKAYGAVAGIDAVNSPKLLAEYPHALGAALYFWSSRGPSLSTDADGGINDATCTAITKVVNGGTNGLDDRLHYMDKFAEML
jgi:putative chitinase